VNIRLMIVWVTVFIRHEPRQVTGATVSQKTGRNRGQKINSRADFALVPANEKRVVIVAVTENFAH
jgi:hypothetical protein